MDQKFIIEKSALWGKCFLSQMVTFVAIPQVATGKGSYPGPNSNSVMIHYIHDKTRHDSTVRIC